LTGLESAALPVCHVRMVAVLGIKPSQNPYREFMHSIHHTAKSGPGGKTQTSVARRAVRLQRTRIVAISRRENGTPRETRTLPLWVETRCARSIDTSGAKVVDPLGIEPRLELCRSSVLPLSLRAQESGHAPRSRTGLDRVAICCLADQPAHGGGPEGIVTLICPLKRRGY
jgi:hypothetical protein